MEDYKPTEYAVDFGDTRSTQFIRLNMALIEQNGAKLGERIVRCGDCRRWLRGMCRKHVFTITVDGTEYDEGAFPMDASDFCSLGEQRGDA